MTPVKLDEMNEVAMERMCKVDAVARWRSLINVT
jgi:hypothetical protein